MVERNMCNAVMRGIVVPPGSRALLALKQYEGPNSDTQQNLGCALQSAACLQNRWCTH
jgi:hypothetical protein